MADEAAAAAGASDETAPTAKKSGLIVMLVAAVASLAVGGGVGAFVVGPRLAGGDAGAGDSSDAHGAPAASGGHGEAAESSPIYEMDNLVVNPAGTNGQKFLIVTVAVEVSSNSLVETLNAHDAEIRDGVLHMLASRTLDQLNDLSVRDELKAEVRKTIEGLIGAADVHKIFLPMFVLQ